MLLLPIESQSLEEVSAVLPKKYQNTLRIQVKELTKRIEARSSLEVFQMHQCVSVESLNKIDDPARCSKCGCMNYNTSDCSGPIKCFNSGESNHSSRICLKIIITTVDLL
ncbi:hypothetical protein RF11_15467 [Thelohanellus kitauei]|uniref:Uncharacterized protein n=1 Tax=Thelohanellus kitauei TaxID=669202 RepID=A0A0C2I9S3_THEKT|nr:hypothetical protein RF11_15467 [Thelohanellus kitauei]